MKLTDLVTFLAPTPKRNKGFARPYWTASIGEAQADGTDKESALSALCQVVTQAFEGDYSPYLMSFRGYQIIIWRTPQNWSYKVLDNEKRAKSEGKMIPLWGVTSYDTEQEVLGAVRYHLAEIAWNGVEETSPIIQDKEKQDLFGRNARWQKRYKELASSGMPDRAIRDQLMDERV